MNSKTNNKSTLMNHQNMTFVYSGDLLMQKNGKKNNHCLELNYNEYKAETPQNIANTFATYIKDLYCSDDDEGALTDNSLLQQDH